MSSPDIQRVEALFHAARRLPAPDREQFLSCECGGDVVLRSSIEALLIEDSRSCPLLDETRLSPYALFQIDEWTWRAVSTPRQIGKYRIVRVLGEGGMGVVYEAEQANPRRTVALKVVRIGAVPRQTLRRFEHESTILGRLQHPGVAQIYEAGVEQTAHGPQPYFAMELVCGRPLIDDARHRQLNLHERLELFARVCDAVHYAHQRGVIHRDLKSANILVDNRGQPKVLDFGIARTTDADLAISTVQTGAGAFLGTLQYMSPEQLSGDPSAIDIRCDIYSLGVMLFELLTGRLPYDVSGKSVPQAAEVIATQEPASPATIDRRLRGDLETIALKALEKDKEQRYPSAAEFAADVRRHLAGEPIAARRHSTLYVLRKTLLRHRGVTIACGAAIVALTAFAVYAGLQANRFARIAAQERSAREAAQAAQRDALLAQQEAARERDEAGRAHDLASTQRQIAERASQWARQTTTLLWDIADPEEMPTATKLDHAVLEAALPFDGEPATEARLRLKQGQSCAARGELGLALEHLAGALELHVRVLRSEPQLLYDVLSPYVSTLEDRSDWEWNRRWRQLWRIYPLLLKSTNPKIAAAISRLQACLSDGNDPQERDNAYAEFLHVSETTLAANNRAVWLTLADFLHTGGSTVALRGERRQGCRLFADALAIERRFLSEAHARIVRTRGALIKYTLLDGRPQEAEPLAREALELLEKTLPADHWMVALSRGRLGAALAGADQFEQAEAMLRESLTAVETALGPSNIHAQELVTHQIALYQAWNRPQARERCRRSLAARIVGSDQTVIYLEQVRPALTSEHAEFYPAIERLSAACGRAEPMGPALEDFLQLRRQLLPDEDELASLIANLLQLSAGRRARTVGLDDETLLLLREAEVIVRAGEWLHPWKKAEVLWWLAYNLESRGQYVEAEPRARHAVEILEAQFGARDCFVFNARKVLGGCLLGQRRFEEAEPLLAESYQELLARLGPNNRNTGTALSRLVKLYLATARADEAVSLLVDHCQSADNVRVRWNTVRDVFEALHPRLFACLERLRTARAGDRAATAARIQEALDARRAAFALEAPIALLYANGLYEWGEHFCWTSATDPLWESAFREVVSIYRAHHRPNNHIIGNALFLWATVLVERGEGHLAEPLAREALEIFAHGPELPMQNAAGESVLGGALLAQGRLEEAEDLLLTAHPQLVTAVGDGSYATKKCFGYLMRLYAEARQPQRAAQVAEPILRRMLEAGQDAPLLNTLSRNVVCRSGLSPELYRLALKASEAACGLNPDNPALLDTLALAQFRTGQFEQSAATFLRIEALGAGLEYHAVAVRAMVLTGLGRIDVARDASRLLRERTPQNENLLSFDERSLIRESQQLFPADPD